MNKLIENEKFLTEIRNFLKREEITATYSNDILEFYFFEELFLRVYNHGDCFEIDEDDYENEFVNISCNYSDDLEVISLIKNILEMYLILKKDEKSFLNILEKHKDCLNKTNRVFKQKVWRL